MVRYVEPERFREYERMGQQLGFAFVASGPLVRSSYRAAEAFVEARLRPDVPRPVASERDDPGWNDRLEPHVAPAHGPALVAPSTLVRGRR